MFNDVADAGDKKDIYPFWTIVHFVFLNVSLSINSIFIISLPKNSYTFDLDPRNKILQSLVVVAYV